MSLVEQRPPASGTSLPVPTIEGDSGPPVPPEGDRGKAAKLTLISDNSMVSLTDQEIVGEVLQLFHLARDRRKPMVARWIKNYQLLRNKYWADLRPGWMPAPAIPEIFPIVASMVGWSTDRRINIGVIPSSMPFTQYSSWQSRMCQDLKTVMDSSWHVNNEENQLTIMLWDEKIYGTGILKTTWDNTMNGGQGDAIIRRVDPFTFYPDPDARDLDGMNYCIEARTMSMQELDRRFPGSYKVLQESISQLDTDEAPTQLQPRTSHPDMANPGAISPETRANWARPGTARLKVNEQAGITVLECWIREHQLYDANWVDQNGKEQQEQRLYDSWRCIVVAGNRVLFNERADEMWSHARHPYSRYVSQDLGEMWGLSLVEMLASPQEALNRILAAIQSNVELVGNPVFVEDTRSGTQKTRLTNKPGARLTKNAGGDVGWLEPPDLQPLLPELLRFYLQAMERVSGLSAITRGGSQGGRNAQGVIDSMQEAAFVRIRMGLRNLEFTLRDAGQLKASLICEFYTQPRMLAIIGNQGVQETLALSSHHFYLPGQHGATPLKFQLMIDAGSNSHTSRKVKEDQAMMLYSIGAFDEFALLEVLGVPNWQVIAERVKKQKAMGLLEPPGSRQKAQRKS